VLKTQQATQLLPGTHVWWPSLPAFHGLCQLQAFRQAAVQLLYTAQHIETLTVIRTCKVNNTIHAQDASWVPHHVGDGAVHDEVPEADEQAQRREVHPARQYNISAVSAQV
jgi:hypothetical protein